MKTVCKVCGKPLETEDKKGLCGKCKKKKQIALLMKGVKVGKKAAFVAVLTFKVIRKVNEEKKKTEPEGVSEKVKKDTTGSQKHLAGAIYWNAEKCSWETDGVAYTYRVQYRDIRDQEIHTEEYEDIDCGYEAYEQYKKEWYASDVKWEHIHPERKTDVSL